SRSNACCIVPHSYSASVCTVDVDCDSQFVFICFTKLFSIGQEALDRIVYKLRQSEPGSVIQMRQHGENTDAGANVDVINGRSGLHFSLASPSRAKVKLRMLKTFARRGNNGSNSSWDVKNRIC